MDSKDFETSNQNIGTEVNDTIEAVNTDISEVSENVDNIEKPADIQEDKYFIRRPTGNLFGGVMEFFGFSLAVFFIVLWIGLCALVIVLDGASFLLVPMIIVVAIIGLFLLMGIKGRIMRNRIKRFKKYKYTLDGREFCDISELAEAVEKCDEFVVSDLKKMIDMQWFVQGHVDDEEKHLIITDLMYEHYTMAMAVLKARQMKAEPEIEKVDEAVEMETDVQ